MKVGYLGPEGTHSERAAKEYSGGVIKKVSQLIPCVTIPLAFKKLCAGDVEEIIVPVENSIEGTVNITLDMLFLHPQFFIIGEVIIAINHCLLSKETTTDIKTIYSHPQALAQCQNYLNEHHEDAEIIPVESTAKAAMLAAQKNDAAAVASIQAGEKYGLSILKNAIQDYRANLTSFWVIGRKKATALRGPAETASITSEVSAVSKVDANMTSLVVALPRNKPGGLHSILGILAEYNINLTKIQSRPTKKELGEYLFYIDFEGHCQDENVKKSLEILKERCSFFRILGSYQALTGGGRNE